MDERFEKLKKYNFWGENTPQVGFIRKDYTDKIYSGTGNRLIKVLVGQRRVGKSYILRQLAAKLIKSGVNRKNIFLVNRELADFDFLSTYKDLDSLFKLYKEQLKPQGRIYIFIDEIQNIEGWEKIINSYSQDYIDEYEVFISGSNSKLLSGELATLLSGRYIKFEIFPLSYNELINIKDLEDSKLNYIKYMQSSGMPELLNLDNEEFKRNYIAALRDTVLLRDIIQRYKIKDASLLENIFVYLVNNASNLISIKNITNYFKSKGRKTSYETVASYIGFLIDSYLVHKTEKYNIKGKETVAGNSKYYINDLSFNNYLYKGFAYGDGYLLENIVYLELLRFGYIVYTGNIRDKEVDFVAIKGDRTIYLQCTYMLIDKKTAEREYSALEAIDDNYEKVIVSLDDIARNSKDGIRNILAWKLRDFL